MRGVVRRVRVSGAAGVVRFEFYLELPSHVLLVMAAKKLARAFTSYYALSLDPGDISRDSPSYLGKLRASGVGGDGGCRARGWQSKQSLPSGHAENADHAPPSSQIAS